nr:unnamed protein product [Zea mays]CAA28053.1 unnamed protein product [Zea mays]
MAPLKLYGMPLSPNVVRVATVLNEKGLDFEIVPVDLTTGAHKQPDFLALNPFGQIPALVDGDEVLFESRAINRYIASKYASEGTDLLPATASAAKLEVWLEVESHHFYPNRVAAGVPAAREAAPGRRPDAAVVDKHAEQLAKVLDVYERTSPATSTSPGTSSRSPTPTTRSYLLYLSKTPRPARRRPPHVKAWWEAIVARPAFQKTVAAIPLPPPPSSSA